MFMASFGGGTNLPTQRECLELMDCHGKGKAYKLLEIAAGLVASTREDSMYYRLNSVAGEPLRLNFRYRIEGDDFDADWWSITAYGWDNYLIANNLKRYSFNNENIDRREDGSWVINIGTEQQAGITNQRDESHRVGTVVKVTLTGPD